MVLYSLTSAKCNMKSITGAYHVYCKPCANTDNVCRKCLQSNQIIIDQSTKSIPKITDLVMNERQRRTYMRRMERGELEEEEVELVGGGGGSVGSGSDLSDDDPSDDDLSDDHHLE